ncbi:CPBP family intramembrane metalloprotease [Streptomonospora sediminis]
MTAHSTPTAPGGYRSDLILFMVVAFAVSWIAWGAAIALAGTAAAQQVYVLGAFGPLVAALVLRIRRGRRGEPVPAHAVRARRAGTLLWTPPLLVLASALVVVAVLVAQAAGEPAPTLAAVKDTLNTYGGVAAFLIGLLISGPLAEEAGWRGTAYPRMRASMGRFQVSLVLGAIWAVWHLPLFFVEGSMQHMLGIATPSGVLFAISSVPMAMLVCGAYDRGGVVAAIAVHFATNATMVLAGVQEPVTQALIMGVQLIAAVILLATSPADNKRTAAAPSTPATPAPHGDSGARA